jgi:hypothetical protein
MRVTPHWSYELRVIVMSSLTSHGEYHRRQDIQYCYSYRVSRNHWQKVSQGEDSLIHQPIAQGNRHITAVHVPVVVSYDRAPVEISAAEEGTEKIPAGIVNQLCWLRKLDLPLGCKEHLSLQVTLHSQRLRFGCTVRSLTLGLNENYSIWVRWKAMPRKTPHHVPLRISPHMNAQRPYTSCMIVSLY